MTTPTPQQYADAIKRVHETRRTEWPDPQFLIESRKGSAQMLNEVAIYASSRWDTVENVEDAVQTFPLIDSAHELEQLTDVVCLQLRSSANAVLGTLLESRDDG